MINTNFEIKNSSKYNNKLSNQKKYEPYFGIKYEVIMDRDLFAKPDNINKVVREFNNVAKKYLKPKPLLKRILERISISHPYTKKLFNHGKYENALVWPETPLFRDFTNAVNGGVGKKNREKQLKKILGDVPPVKAKNEQSYSFFIIDGNEKKLYEENKKAKKLFNKNFHKRVGKFFPLNGFNGQNSYALPSNHIIQTALLNQDAEKKLANLAKNSEIKVEKIKNWGDLDKFFQKTYGK